MLLNASGTVMGKSPKGVVVQLKGPIKRGDGIVLDRGKNKRYERREAETVKGMEMDEGRWCSVE